MGTDLPEVHRFNREHGDVIAVGKTAQEFAAAIEREVANAGVEPRQRRIAVAERNGWSRRLADMSALIDDAVASRGHDARGWEERLRRLYATARRRTAEGLIGAVALYLLLFQTPALWWAAAPLQLSAPPQAADAIVVFAGPRARKPVLQPHARGLARTDSRHPARLRRAGELLVEGLDLGFGPEQPGVLLGIA